MSMQSIMSAANSLSKLQTMQSANSRNQGQINVLNAEIKSDGGNEHKEKQVDELTEKSESLTESIMKEMTDVNESMKPENNEEEKEEEIKAKEPKTDKVELSGRHEGVEGKAENKAIAAISAEPMTYAADGEKNAVDKPEKGIIDELV